MLTMETINRLASVWETYVVHAALQSALVALLILGIVRLGRRWPSPLRYGLLVIALLKFAAPPMMTLPTGLFGRVRPLLITASAPRVTTTDEEIRTTPSHPSPSNSSPALETSPAPSPAKADILPESPLTTDIAIDPIPRGFQKNERIQFTWPALLMSIHLLGMLALGFWLSLQIVRLSRTARNAEVIVQGELHEIFSRLSRRMRLRKTPRLLVTDEPFTPAAFGVAIPTVIIPRAMYRTMSEQELTAMLGHELAHLRRRDPAVNWIQLLLLAFWWFNPVYWILTRTVRRVREDCCDDLLLSSGIVTGDLYSETLLHAARELTSAPPAGAVLGMAERIHPLGRRLQRILDLRLRRTSRLSWAGLFAVLVFAALLLPGAGNQAQEAPQKTEKQPFTPRGVLSGRVIDEAGAPIKDLDLSIAILGGEAYKAKTDADGIYSFEKIGVGGDYRLWIESNEYFGFPNNWLARPEIHLTENSQGSVYDLTLKRACQLDVLVVDESERPLGGAYVFVSPVTGEFSDSGPSGQTIKGKARLGGLEPSTTPYLLTATHSSYAPEGIRLNLADPGQIVWQKIVLHKGISVQGRAMCSDGKPASGWKIYVQPDWWQGSRLLDTYGIDKEGRFTLPHVNPGKHSLHIYFPEKHSSYQVAVAMLPPESGTLEIQVPEPSPGSTVSISGEVVLPDRKRERYIEISVITDKYIGGSRIPLDTNKFEITGLSPGVYDLQFSSEEVQQTDVKGIKAPSSGLRVELNYENKPRLTGVVLNDASSQPLKKFKIRVLKLRTLRGPNFEQEDKWIDIENPEGKFDVEVLVPGIYEVQASADGLAWIRSREINTDSKQDQPVEIRLGPGASIRGRVTDEAGKSIAGAKVIPLSKAGGAMDRTLNRFTSEAGEAISAADGSFALSHLAAGRETLKVIHPDYCFTLVSDLELKDRAEKVIDIKLTEGGTVRGRIYDESGKPKPGAILNFQDGPGYGGESDRAAGRIAIAVADDQGAYEVRHLPAQLLHVALAEEWKHHGVVRQAILPLNGGTSTLNFGAPASTGGRIVGRLVEGGKPVANLPLILSGGSPHFGVLMAHVTTDSNGKFTFAGILTGTRTIYAAITGARGEYAPVKTLDLTPQAVESAEDYGVGDLSIADGRVTIEVISDNPAAPKENGRIYLVEYMNDTTWMQSVGRSLPAAEKNGPVIVMNVPPGHYGATLYLTDHVSVREFFNLPEGKKENLVQIKSPRATGIVEGRYDVKGNRQFFILSADKRILGSIQPEGDHYRLDHLPAANYRLCGSGDFDAPYLQFSLAEGETKTLDLLNAELSRADTGSITIEVFADTGTPLPGAKVQLLSGDSSAKPIGGWEYSHAFAGKPGQYTLVVNYPGYKETRRDVTIEPASGETGKNEQQPIKVLLERVK